MKTKRNSMKRLLILVVWTVCVAVYAQDMNRQLFNDGWRFLLADKTADYSGTNVDDSAWRTLDLPHDWAVEGDFSQDNPSGTGGGALPGGVGWYRKTFTLDNNEGKASQKAKENGKKKAKNPKEFKYFRLDFDGVYMNATVWVNGHKLGTRPYGYISFGYDITPYLHLDGENTVAVRVDNSDQPNSRWYSGCGIYRNVWLTALPQLHVDTNGVYVTTSVNGITTDKNGESISTRTTLTVRTTVRNEGEKPRKAKVVHYMHDPQDKHAAKSDYAFVTVPPHDTASVVQTLTLSDVLLWSPESPHLYSLTTNVIGNSGGVVNGAKTAVINGLGMSLALLTGVGFVGVSFKDGYHDIYHTPIGFRRFAFTDKGLTLNDKPLQIQGVCNHHDLGCLGAVVNTTGMIRQLTKLKEIGINGIRCSHNPPSPELLQLCDEMGFIVMDESFDMWRKKKTANDYAKYFNEWHERDLRDFVLRDRNHPSILLWSIGNEVLEQWSHADADTLSLEEANLILNFGHSADQLAKEDGEMSVNSLLTKKLADMVRQLDSTRPITAGCNEPAPGNHLFRSGALDVIGYNYHNPNVADVHKNFPGKPFIITESNSALMTRGYYRMPSDYKYKWPERWDKPFADPTYSCSSYENCHAPWGNTHEETLLLMKRNPWITGQYVWTGFDYIGEPTPYGWPARSSYFGIFDLAGFPKDVAYLYKAELTNDTVLHLFPHWNWGDETYAGEGIAPSLLDENGMVDLWAYYNNADEVELFVNGESQGRKSKGDGLDSLHVWWRVKYAPGEIRAVSYKGGTIVAEAVRKTAGRPDHVVLVPEKKQIFADGRDLSYVDVYVCDKDGNICPNASNLVKFSVSGPAKVVGVDNGSPISLERFQATQRRAFYGSCLVVLQGKRGQAGTATLTATSDGLQGSTIELPCIDLSEGNGK